MNEPNDRCQLVPLSQLAVIVAEGPDAGAFLGAQLGRSLPVTDRTQGVLAAWHDAKGRVQGLFRVFAAAETCFWLTTPADAAAGIVADLRRYVLRSRLELRVDDGGLDCIALLGACEASAAMAAERGLLIAQPGPALVIAVGPATAAAPLRAALPTGSRSAFELMEIRLGIPRIDAPLRGQFLPQMLDLDRLGAVEFDKGCYPGQEVIVRLQHRGNVKRRLVHLAGPAAPQDPQPGDPLADPAGERVGQVVRAATSSGGLELLAVIEVSAASEPLRLEGASTPVLASAHAE